jgi:hypothetical protein
LLVECKDKSVRGGLQNSQRPPPLHPNSRPPSTRLLSGTARLTSDKQPPPSTPVATSRQTRYGAKDGAKVQPRRVNTAEMEGGGGVRSTFMLRCWPGSPISPEAIHSNMCHDAQQTMNLLCCGYVSNSTT